MKTRTVSYGVFIALALIFSYVETLIPIHLGIPGVKLGLANLITVIALYKIRAGEVYLLSVIRVVIAGFMFGSMFSIIYSLAGSILSLTVMILLKKNGRFSIVGVSIAGGVFHNIGQMCMAMMLIETYSVLYYLPVLLTAGVITGAVIGITANEMMKRLTKIEL